MKENNYQSSERMDYNQHEKGNITLLGNKAYADDPMIFPPICIKCGSSQVEEKKFQKKLTYCPSWVYLLFFISILVLLIVYYLVRKQVDVHYYLCPGCWDAHKTKRTINAVMWLGFLGLLISAIALESGELGILSLAAFIGGLVTAVLASTPLRVDDYDKPQFLVKGFKEDFVNAFKRRSA